MMSAREKKGLEAVRERSDRLFDASIHAEAGEQILARLCAAVDGGVPVPDAMLDLLLELFENQWLVPDGKVVYLDPALKDRLRNRARTLRIPVSTALSRAVREFLSQRAETQ